MLIRYYGNIGGESGYATAAREFCMSMLEAGLDFEISASTGEIPPGYLPLASRVRDRPALTPNPDVAIVHTLPLDCKKVLALDDLSARPGLRRIAYTTWEGSGCVSDEIACAMAPFDDVWVPCAYNRVDFRPQLPASVRVSVVPHACDPGQAIWCSRELGDERRPSPDLYRFYYIGVWQARKNVDGLIRAYLRAFNADDHVQLLIHSPGAPDTAVATAVVAAQGHTAGPSIAFSRTWLGTDQLAEIHAIGHCYVTACRGEAWNLPAFDAMIANNHIIAPAEMGHDEYLRGTSADLYTSRRAPAHGEIQILGPAGERGYRGQYVGAQGLSCKDDWREPDLIELAELMRLAYSERKTGITLNYAPTERYSRAAVGRRIRHLLENGSDQ